MDEFPLPKTEKNEVEKMIDKLFGSEEPTTEEEKEEKEEEEEEEEEEESSEESSWDTIVLDVKVPRFKDRISIEMKGRETVLQLKEKILNHGGMLQPIPVERIVLQSHCGRARELLDHQYLEDYALSEYPDNEIDLFIKPPLPQPPPKQVDDDVDSKKLKVTVLQRDTKEKIQIEVNAEDTVAVLREKLEELHQTHGFPLPTDGPYFFIHRKIPMAEKMSFQWHRVQQGDTIETAKSAMEGDAGPSKTTKTDVDASK